MNVIHETCLDKVSVNSEWTGKQLPGYAFCLPDLDRLAPDFRNFLERDLIEAPTQKRLEASSMLKIFFLNIIIELLEYLNWWSSFGQKLYPLSTTGDGNCLLHAASLGKYRSSYFFYNERFLGMWGLHDRMLTLREALYEMIIRGSRRTALWRRWKWSEHKSYSVSYI